MENYYVYVHKKPDGKIFYVGMGKNKRAWSISDRNNLWKKIVSKYGKHTVEIIIDNISHLEAIKIEMEFIAKYGRIDIGTGILSNLTDGGDGGVIGLKQSKETIEKRVKHFRGKSPSKETRKKIGEPQKGSNNHYAKKIMHIESGKIYNCIKEASEYYNINYSTLRRQLANPIKKKLFIYV